MSALGTIHELSTPPGMVSEQDESPNEDARQDTFDSTASVTGSDPIGISTNRDALHSTVIIKSSRIAHETDDEAPSGLKVGHQNICRLIFLF